MAAALACPPPPVSVTFPPFPPSYQHTLLYLVLRYSTLAQSLATGALLLLLAHAPDATLFFVSLSLFVFSAIVFLVCSPPLGPFRASSALAFLSLSPFLSATSLLFIASTLPWPSSSRYAAAASALLLVTGLPAARALPLLSLYISLFVLLPSARRGLSGRYRALLAAAHIGGAAALLLLRFSGTSSPPPPVAALVFLAAAAGVPLLGAPVVLVAQRWRADCYGPWDLPRGAPPEEAEGEVAW